MKRTFQIQSLLLSRFFLVLFMVIAMCLFAPSALRAETLADAVDAPTLTWTTGGSLPWIGQTNFTFDGVDAAQSGVIGNSQESWLQTTVTGPGSLVFRWKVSSEYDFDYLEFYLNGVLQNGRISGNWGWEQRTLALPAGVQTARWRYKKDGSATSDQDRGWVDTVSFAASSGPATIAVQPQNRTTNQGVTVSFVVVAGGTPPLAYFWRKNALSLTNQGNISGANSATLKLNQTSKSDEGGYSVVVTNSFGSVTSVVATLIVNDPYIPDDGQPSGQDGNVGGDVYFSVFPQNTSSQPLSYQRYHDGAEVTGGTNDTLALQTVTQTDAGLYYVVVTNSFGSVTSAVATLTFRDPYITQHPVGASKNGGDDITFEVTGGGTPPVSYQWYFNGAMVFDATNSLLLLQNLSKSNAGVYAVIITNSSGSITSAPAMLTVNAVTLDSALSLGLDGRFDEVLSMVVQPDGRILVGGDFESLAGQPRTNIARLNPDGTLDGNFNPAIGEYFNPGVYSLALQPDGKILVGGSFSSIAGQPRFGLGRLNADGTLDGAFNPGVAGWVYCLALQPDGKILVGGEFSNLGGQSRTNLGRLNADGTLDTSFSPGAAAVNYAAVFCLALQPDGKILVGGSFETLAGQSIKNLGRLNTNGSPDSAFNPKADSYVDSLVVQPDGKILLAGVSSLGGQPRQGLGRINGDGTLDSTCNPGLDSSPSTLALQADGKIVIGGNFYTVNGQVRNGLARLNADGTLDLTFNPGRDGYDICLTLQPDGKILVGGRFEQLLGQPRNGIGRLVNTDPAMQSLDHVGSTVTWPRGGTTPEVWRTTFDYSVDGIWWTNVGTGTRITGGWQITNTSLPADAAVRARGHVSGDDKGSSWFVEQYQGRPVFAGQPSSFTNDLGTSAIFRATAGGSMPLSYQWFKNGVALLNGANISGVNGSILTLNPVSNADEGSYSLVVSNNFGSVTSVVAILVVNDPFITQQPVGADVNTGTNVTFQVTANGTPPLSYQWSRNGAALLGATNSSLTLSNLSQADAGLYTVVIGGPQGSITSTPALLTVRPPLLVNPTPVSGDLFGSAVAALGADRLIVGAPDDDTGATDAGTVYLFNANRVLLTTITNPTPAFEDYFGTSVAALGNDRVIIGAPGDNTGASDAGAVYLFSTNGTLLNTFTNPTPASDEEFGIAVAAVGGDRVLIGAWGEDNTSVFGAGAAYLYNTNGKLLVTFVNPTPYPGDAFGRTVALVGNDRVLIGAQGDDGGAEDSGAAYLFNLNGNVLTTFTNPTPRSSEYFGYSVSAVGNDQVLIGAPYDNTGGTYAGAAYLFSTNGTLLTTFTNPAASSPLLFGSAMTGVGKDRVLIGAHIATLSPGAGAAYLFSTAGNLLSTITDPNPVFGGYFGVAMAMVGSDRVLIGASEDGLVGAAYLFELDGPPNTGPAPTLSIVSTGGGSVTISWSPNTAGFVLQESSSMSLTGWTNSSDSTSPIVIPATHPMKFYRLLKP